MKIAIMVNQFPALSQTFILNQITGLIDRGHEVEIYANTKGGELRSHPDIKNYDLIQQTYYRPKIPRTRMLRLIKGIALLLQGFYRYPEILPLAIKALKYKSQARWSMLFFSAIPLLGKQASYDVIQCHFGPNGIIGTLLRELNVIRGKVFTTFHGYDMTRYPRIHGNHVYDWLFANGDFFLPISEYWMNKLIELGCNNDKIIVHRMGIDCKKFTFQQRKKDNDGPIKIVSIARLVEKKGIEYGVRAIAELAIYHKNLEYQIIGDGPLLEDLQALVNKLEIGGQTILVGWKEQQEVIEILDRAHILLAPSITSEDGDQEGVPVVLMEAMAMGLPVVSTLHSGIPELVIDGVTGFLVPERDVGALVEKLTYLVEEPKIWSHLGQAGREYVMEHYNIDKQNDRLVNIFQELVCYNYA